MSEFPSILRLSNINLDVHAIICLSSHPWTSILLKIVKNATVSLQDSTFDSSGYTPRKTGLLAHGSSVFNFLRDLIFYTVNCTILHSQWLHKGPNFSTSSPIYVIVIFLVITILTGVR